MNGEREPRPVRPISPDEVTGLRREIIPGVVLETFNRMIGETVLHGRAVVKQAEVVAALVEQGLERSLIFQKGWLNVEEIYREAGWEVRYEKPGYNEEGEATFTFRDPKHGR